MKFCTVQFRNLLFASTASMAAVNLMSLVDRIVAGNLLGEKALAGLGLCTVVDQLTLFVAMLVACGTSVRFLSAMGRFREDEAGRALGCGLLASVAAGVVVAAGVFFACDAYLGTFGADPETFAFASTYARWIGTSVLVLPFEMFLLVMVYADGDERTCLVAYPTQLAVNAVASWFLCRRWGVAGCAVGTALGYAASTGVLATHFLRKANSLSFVWCFSWRELLAIARGSCADAAVSLCEMAVSVVICGLVSALAPAMLPVASALLAFTGFSHVFDGVPQAAQPLLEVYFGERNYRRVQSLMGTATAVVCAEGLLMTLVAVAFPGLVLGAVGLDDPALAAPASAAIRVVGASMVFWALASLYNSYYQYIDQPAVACVLVVLKDLLAPLAFLFAGAAAGGFSGMWLGYALAAPLAVGAFALWILRARGRGLFPLLVPRSRNASTFVWDTRADAEGAASLSRAIASVLAAQGERGARARMAPLIVEETVMLVNERNRGRNVRVEVSLDLTDAPVLIIRDDGEIFDLTDADQRIESFRTYLVAELMHAHKERRNLTTTGFNRNRFEF